MRQTISGLITAIAVFTAAPAMACGGLFGGGCSPCSPCAQTYVPTYSGCNTGCGGGAYERLPDPEVQYQAAPTAMPQYYYVDQGPTFTGPGDFAPRRVYREGGIYGWGGYHHHRHHHYGYEGHWYHHRHWHHYATPYQYGYHHHQHVLHSYY
jgi:hypothetical protein